MLKMQGKFRSKLDSKTFPTIGDLNFSSFPIGSVNSLKLSHMQRLFVWRWRFWCCSNVSSITFDFNMQIEWFKMFWKRDSILNNFSPVKKSKFWYSNGIRSDWTKHKLSKIYFEITFFLLTFYAKADWGVFTIVRGGGLHGGRYVWSQR